MWHLAAGSSDIASAVTSWTSGDVNAAVTGQSNFMDNTSNQFYLTGVQLEASDSDVATDFEHRSFAQELALCHRYFISGMAAIGSAYNGDGGSVVHGVYLTFPTIMRASPTITFPTNHSTSNVADADYTYHVSSTGFSYRVNLSATGNYHRQSTYNAAAEL